MYQTPPPEHYKQFKHRQNLSRIPGREHEAVGRLLAQIMSSVSPCHYWRKQDQTAAPAQPERPFVTTSQDDDVFGELLEPSFATSSQDEDLFGQLLEPNMMDFSEFINASSE